MRVLPSWKRTCPLKKTILSRWCSGFPKVGYVIAPWRVSISIIFHPFPFSNIRFRIEWKTQRPQDVVNIKPLGKMHESVSGKALCSHGTQIYWGIIQNGGLPNVYNHRWKLPNNMIKLVHVTGNETAMHGHLFGMQRFFPNPLFLVSISDYRDHYTGGIKFPIWGIKQYTLKIICFGISRK